MFTFNGKISLFLFYFWVAGEFYQIISSMKQT